MISSGHTFCTIDKSEIKALQNSCNAIVIMKMMGKPHEIYSKVNFVRRHMPLITICVVPRIKISA